MFGHPTRYELTEYAEALVDGKPVPARIGKHLTSCAACKAQVNLLRESFSFLADAPMLDCTPGSAEQILATARLLRKAERRNGRFFRKAFGVAQGLACASGVVLVAVWVFAAAVGEPAQIEPNGRKPAANRLTAAPAIPSQEELQRKTSEIQSLASAVNAQSDTPASLWERQHRHMILALHADRNAALAALKRNPGCLRASRLVTANLEREAQTLRTLYVEQGR